MGKFFSKIFGSKEIRILMLGLDASGKTSMFTKLSPCRKFLICSIFVQRFYTNSNLVKQWLQFPLLDSMSKR